MLSPASTITLSNYPFVHVLNFSGRALCGAEEAEKTRVSKLTEIAYFLAKEEIAFKKFPAHVQQEMRHGVKLRGAYLNEKGCREFTECINDAMVEDLKNKIKNTAFYSVLTDGSTDSGILEKELTYILFLDAEGQLVSTLLGLNDVEHGTAEGLKKVLEETFAKMDMGNFKTHLVGLGADGANVNLGKKKGLAALLRAEIPWLVSVHCFNHRLELAMRDALDKTYYSEITNTLMLLFYAYKNSPKRLRELKALGDIMNEVVNKPLKAHGTRWVQHKLQATEALLKSYSVVVAHLENMANDKTHDQAKAKGILDKVNNFKFVSHLLYFQHLLRPISRLSVTWQKEVVEAPLVLATLNNLKQTLGNMKDQQEYPGELKDLIASAQQSVDADDQLQNPITGDAENEPQQPVMFKGTQLKKVKVGLGYFLRHSQEYVVAIEKELEKRFDFDTKENEVLKSTRILDIRLWPDDDQNLGAYGNEDIANAAECFKDLLTVNMEDFDLDNVLPEWRELKMFIRDSGMAVYLTDPSTIWAKCHKNFFSRFPTVMRIINILRVLPWSNGIVERCFSTMNKVKTDWRSTLGADSLEMLVRIKKTGPPCELYDACDAVELFFSKKPRRSMQPDECTQPGPSKKHKSD